MTIDATFESNDSLTLVFPELSAADSYHLGYLHGVLLKLRVPVAVVSGSDRRTAFRIGVGDDAGGRLTGPSDPTLPFTAKTGGD